MSRFEPGIDDDGRLYAPATERNRDAILDVLKQFLPDKGTVLEIASGTGEHACYFSKAFPHLHWQPSDVSPEHLISIDAWRSKTEAISLLPPIKLDARQEQWPVEANPPAQPITAVLAINMIHISPWVATERLISGAGRVLGWGGVLIIYGPFKFDGKFSARSNEAFDRDLRAQDPEWGVREYSNIRMLAGKAGFSPPDIIEMPANNHSLIFRRS